MNNISTSPEILRQAAEEAADPVAVVETALKALDSDPGAVFEENVLAALKTIRRKGDEAAYARLVAQAKGLKTRLDKLTAPERDSHQDSMLTLVLQTARASWHYAHDADGRGIAIIEDDDHREVHFVDGQSFKKRLRAEFYATHKAGIPDQIMSTAISTLTAVGEHEGEQMTVYQRCAKVDDAYVVDIVDDKWQVVRIDKDGAVVQTRSPINFTRTKGMRALPSIESKGDIALLWKHVNIPENRQLLVLAWLLDSLRPDTPFPVLELSGEMGSAKSSAQRRLRDLIDPNEVPLRSRPKTVEDIHVAASNSHVVSYENLSVLTPDQQDALCVVSTGGGYSTRAFYTNGDEFVMKSKNPVIFNGINPVASQADLIDRTISVELPTIPTAERKDERSLEIEWQKDYPAIFSGLIRLLSKALKHLPDVKIDDGMKKRMIDYQMLGEAMCLALEKPAGEFSKVLDEAQSEGILRGLETFGVSNALSVFMLKQKEPWEGTYLGLLTMLSDLQGIDRSHWPKSARGLAAQLKRLAPGLRKAGVTIQHLDRTRAGSRIRISIISE